MGRNEKEIEASIRDELPIIFGRADAMDASEYRREWNALSDSASSFATAFLSPETVRYQSILLYVSLIFGALILLEVSEYKIGEALVSVDRRGCNPSSAPATRRVAG